MNDCCTFYVAQIKSNGVWITLDISSKDINEVNKQLSAFLILNGQKETRIIQKLIKEERAKGRKTPGCC